MTWYEAVSTCFRKCCGRSKETDILTNDLMPSFQSTYTVRRISSFGQTIIDENGEEKEVERHASIITYDGNAVPWTSKPAPVQPGVTHLDIKNQIERMPTITESPLKTKQKHRWKKSGTKDPISYDSKKVQPNENIQLKSIKYTDDSRMQPKSVDNSLSHENIFVKCKKSITPDDPLPLSYLSVQSTPLKSVSTPDLVTCEQLQSIKISSSNSKDSLPRALFKSGSARKNTLQKALTESAAAKLAKQHGLDISLYTEEALSPLNVNVKPSNSSNVKAWTEEPVGTLVLSLHFDILQKLLNVNLNALQSLGDEGQPRNQFPTIIKLTLVGSKKLTKTSKKIEDSCRSNIDQSFVFLIKDMDFRSMRISIYNADWIGKHDAIAHGLLSLQHLLEKTTSIQLKLYSQPIFGTEVGLMQIYFSYDGSIFHMTVEKIFDFDPKLRKCKLYSKIAYYSQSKKMKERMSNLVWSEYGDSEIRFDHSASFKVDTSGKKHSYIVVTLKSGDNQSMFKPDKTLGRITFGPCFYYEGGKKLTPWGKAIINKEKVCHSFKMYL